MPNQDRIIIDAHTHIFPSKISLKATKSIGSFYEIPMHHKGSPESLLRHGAQIGVCRYLVCSTATTAEQVRHINEFIAENVALHPEFTGLATMHPEIKDFEKEIDYALSLGLKGFKLHHDFQKFNLDEPSFFPVYEYIAQKNVPILFHMGDARYDYSHPRRLIHLMQEIPNLTAIAAHFGGYQQWQETHRYPKSDRLFFDTSSSLFALQREEALALIHQFGADHFMFGTDFPMWDHEEELNRFLQLKLPFTEEEQIFHQTFESLFSLS